MEAPGNPGGAATEVSPRLTALRRLEATGFFQLPIIGERTTRLLEKEPRGAFVGVCSSTLHGASLGTAFQHLMQHALLKITLEYLGLNKGAVLVAGAISKVNPQAASEWDSVLLRANESQVVAHEFWDEEPFDITVITDWDLERTSLYQMIYRERQALPLHDSLYSMLQDVLVETVRRTLPVDIKIGWASEPRGTGKNSEWELDGRTLAAFGPVFSALYGPPARAFSAVASHVCPYLVKWVRDKNGDLHMDRDGKPYHGRILLSKETNVEEAVPDPLCQARENGCGRTWSIRVAEAIFQLWQEVQLLAAAKPNLRIVDMFGQPTTLKEEVGRIAKVTTQLFTPLRSLETELRELEASTGKASDVYKQRSTALNDVRVGIASALRELVAPVVQQVVNHYAV